MKKDPFEEAAIRVIALFQRDQEPSVQDVRSEIQRGHTAALKHNEREAIKALDLLLDSD